MQRFLAQIMIFAESHIKGVCTIEQSPHHDDRGWFSRSWCRREFHEAGLKVDFKQSNVSYNRSRGTLRGMHYQLPPVQESKLVGVVAGSIFAVALDLRPKSPTLHKWESYELSLENHMMLLIPEGVAHGFQTLADDTTLTYQVTNFFSPEHYRIARWDDPAFDIQWPINPPTVISAQDSEASFAEKSSPDERGTVV